MFGQKSYIKLLPFTYSIPCKFTLFSVKIKQTMGNYLFNPLTAKLFNLNFHPLEVVSR